MPQMPREVKQVRELLRGLPPEDQLGSLLITIMDLNNDALAISLRLLSALSIISECQGTLSRYKLAGLMRDVADRLERPEISRGNVLVN